MLTHSESTIRTIKDSAIREYPPPESDSESEDHKVYSSCTYLDSDTYVNPHSDRAARLCCGGLIDLCVRVIESDVTESAAESENNRADEDDQIENGFALIRPPVSFL